MMLFCVILMAYAVLKVFFASLKRGGILLIQVAVGSLYMLSAPIGLVWTACFEARDGEFKRAVVLGPVFSTAVSLDGIKQLVHSLNGSGAMEVSMTWQHELLGILDAVPTLSMMLMQQYVLMLHYTLSGEKLFPSDINYYSSSLPGAEEAAPQKKDRYRVWLTEQGLMRMVEDGDLNFRFAIDNSISVSSGVPVQSTDPLRQAKTSTIVFAFLCTRAAIKGGLSPEQAYSLGDSYIQAVESSKTVSEIASLSSTL